MVRTSPGRFGGKGSVGRHRAYPSARTRESSTEPQAPCRRVARRGMRASGPRYKAVRVTSALCHVTSGVGLSRRSRCQIWAFESG